MSFKSDVQRKAVMAMLRRRLKVGAVDVAGIKNVQVMGQRYPHFGYYDPRSREIKLRSPITGSALHPKLVARHEVGHHVLYQLAQPTRLKMLNKMSLLQGGPRLPNAQYWNKKGYNAHESFADAYAVLRNKRKFFGPIAKANPIARSGWDSVKFHRNQHRYHRIVQQAVHALRQQRRLRS